MDETQGQSGAWTGDAKDAIVMFRRDKFFLYAGQAIGWFLIFGIIVSLAFVPDIAVIPNFRRYSFLVAGIIILLALIVLLTHWLMWKLTVGVVTAEHVLDIDQHGIFNHEVSSIPIEKVQDVTVKVNGPIEYLLKIGTVIVQSAGELPNFEFPGVNEPAKIADKIMEVVKRGETSQSD